MIKKILVILALCIGLLVFYISEKKTSSLPAYTTQNTKIGTNNYLLFIADSPEKMQNGLSNVASLKSNEGMMFIFENSDRHGFWMKDMLFPLDFLFIENNTIVDLLENMSADTYPNVFYGRVNYDKVIELNAGQIDKNNIKIGDKISIN